MSSLRPPFGEGAKVGSDDPARIERTAPEKGVGFDDTVKNHTGRGRSCCLRWES